MEKGSGRNTKILGFASFLTDASTGMLVPLLPLFLTKVLLAPVLIVGLMEGLDGFMAGIQEFLSGLRSDRSRKSLIVAGYSLSAVVKSLLASASFWPQVAAIRVAAGLGKDVAEQPLDAMLS